MRSHCCLSAKSFLYCWWSRVEGKGERMGVARGEGGEMKSTASLCVAKAT